MNNNNGVTIGISAVDILQIVFVVLKLCKVITWSWWWVLAPTWISILIIIFLVLLFRILDK